MCVVCAANVLAGPREEDVNVKMYLVCEIGGFFGLLCFSSFSEVLFLVWSDSVFQEGRTSSMER